MTEKTRKHRKPKTEEERQEIARKCKETRKRKKEEEMKFREEKLYEIYKHFDEDEKRILTERAEELKKMREEQKQRFIENLSPELASLLFDKLSEMEDYIFAKQLEQDKRKKIKECVRILNNIDYQLVAKNQYNSNQSPTTLDENN